MIADLAPVQLNKLWDHLRSLHHTRAQTAEAFLQEMQSRNPADVIMACLDQRGEDWNAILSALLAKPLYKCAPGETAFPLTDVKGRTIPSPKGHRLGCAPEPIQEEAPPPPTAPRPRKRDDRVIMSVQENPKNPGSKAHARYALYSVGMTVDQFLDGGGRKQDIVYDTQRGFITLGYTR